MPTEEQTYREGVKADLQEIKAQVKYTNGKIRWMEKVLYAVVSAIIVILADRSPEVATLLAHLFAL